MQNILFSLVPSVTHYFSFSPHLRVQGEEEEVASDDGASQMIGAMNKCLRKITIIEKKKQQQISSPPFPLQKASTFAKPKRSLHVPKRWLG